MFALGDLPALGYVAGHLREAAEVAPIVPQGGDDYVSPKSGTVLAYPEALLLVGPLLRRYPQYLLRVVALEVLVCVEDREMLADYLVGSVAFDAVGPCVPSLDMPLRVEHEDGVVLDPLYQEPEALLATVQGLLCLPEQDIVLR